MIAMVEAETEREGRTAHKRHYYLCSAKFDAATFAKAMRAQRRGYGAPFAIVR